MPKSSNYEIKTTLAIDGEKKFKAAMDDANRAMRVHNADLRAMAAEYDYTDDKQQYFAQRAEIVNEKMKQQDAIVEALQRAVKESGDMYGEAARQTDGYRIQLSNATAKMFEMRKEAEQANRDLEELGRDSGKIGREIERGIGDAAEETSEKLDGMFAKVQQDVNALKSSVAFQTTMEIGGFVMDSIQSVVGFVQENDEYNRQIAIAKYNIERYGHNWDDALNLIIDAAAITDNREGALEAMSHLAAIGVQDQELMEAATDALLGVFITTSGALSYESLAESFRESIISKTPTGAYAETLEAILGKNLEEVQKLFEETETIEDTYNLALSYLTEGGFQTTTFNFEEREKEFLDAQRKKEELAKAWADLALAIQPAVTGIIDGTTTLVDGINTIIDLFNGIEWPENPAVTTGEKLGLDESQSKAWFWQQLWNATYAEGPNEYLPGRSPLLDTLKMLIPSAGAETHPTSDLQDYGFKAAQEVATGMMQGMEGNAAVEAAVKTAIAEMDAQDVIDSARLAGKNLMIEFGNGIADGASIPIKKVSDMVAQINATLAGMAMPAYGLGWNGSTNGNVYLYYQQKNAASSISRFIGRGVMNTTLSKK